MTSVGEQMPIEQARVREVLGHYKEIWPAASIGAALIEIDLREADEAVSSGDLVRILRAFKSLKGIKS